MLLESASAPVTMVYPPPRTSSHPCAYLPLQQAGSGSISTSTPHLEATATPRMVACTLSEEDSRVAICQDSLAWAEGPLTRPSTAYLSTHLRPASAQDFVDLNSLDSSRPTSGQSAFQITTETCLLSPRETPLDARNMSVWLKVLTSIAVTFNAFLVSAFGSAYLFIVPTLSQAFACDVGTATAGFVIYILAWGPGPLLWAPLSESIGRKPVYVGSALLWTLFNLGCAKAHSIAVMIICRFLAGLFGCACLTNGGGTNLDIWRGVAISRAIALYSAVLFLGPVCGPIIGGTIQKYAGTTDDPNAGVWRWLFYSAAILGSSSTVLYLCSPETHLGTLTRVHARKGGHESEPHDYAKGARATRLTTKVKVIAGAAITMIRSEPIIIFISLWQTTVMAIIYLFFDAFPIVFGLGHGFDAFQVGLAFLGCGLGMLAACAWSMSIELKLWHARLARAHGRLAPEMRLPQGLMGAILTVIGLFCFAYTSYPAIPWIVPIFGSSIYGFGALSVMLSTFAYVVDTYGSRAAPAFAAIGLIRSIITGFLPLFGTRFYQDLGPRNATLILAVIAVIEVAIPACAKRWGVSLRRQSAFAVT